LIAAGAAIGIAAGWLTDLVVPRSELVSVKGERDRAIAARDAAIRERDAASRERDAALERSKLAAQDAQGTACPPAGASKSPEPPDDEVPGS